MSLDEIRFDVDASATISTSNYLLIGDRAYGYTALATYSGLGQTGDLDTYRINVNAGMTYTIETASAFPLYGPDPANTDFWIIDRSGNPLVRSIDFGSSSSISFTAQDSVYYVQVFSDSVGYYSLRASNNSIVDSNGAGQSLPIDKALSGTFDYASDADLFTFEATAGKSYQFLMLSNVPDPILFVEYSQKYYESLVENGSGRYIFTPTLSGPFTLELASNTFFNTGDYSIQYSEIDTTPPVITTITPALGSSGFPVDQAITLGFNENVKVGAGNIVLRLASNGTVVETFPVSTSHGISVVGATFSVKPGQSLQFGETYTLEIPAGAIQDSAGNTFQGASGYLFSTAKQGNTAPTSSSTNLVTNESGFLIGDLPTASDAQGDKISYSTALAPGHGEVTIQGDGHFSYLPAPHFSGLDLFKFSVTDPSGAASTYTVNVRIEPVAEHFVGTDGNDSFDGYAGGDVYELRDGNDRVAGGADDDVILGGNGFDTANYAANRSAYVIDRGDSFAVSVSSSAEGRDTLTGIERLKFLDRWVAIDSESDGHASGAAQILRALFGTATMNNPDFAGYGVVLLDQGMSYGDLIALAVQTEAFWSLAGDLKNHSNAAFVRTVYKNVTGIDVPPGDLKFFVDLLDSGAMTQVSLGQLACHSPLNTASADLIGVLAHGLDYNVPPELA